MEGVPNLEQHIETPETQKEKPESDILRGGRRWFNRLVGGAVIGVAALAPQGEANAGQGDVLMKQMAAGIFNQAGAASGISVRPGMNGEPVFNYDHNQAMRMAELRRQQEMQRQQQMKQMQQQASFEQFLQQPTNIGWDDAARDFFNKNGLKVSPASGSFQIFDPSNANLEKEGSVFTLKGGNFKYTTINFRQVAVNAFFIDLQYVVISSKQRGTASVMVKYDPIKKIFSKINL